jgi:cell division protein FtsB
MLDPGYWIGFAAGGICVGVVLWSFWISRLQEYVRGLEMENYLFRLEAERGRQQAASRSCLDCAELLSRVDYCLELLVGVDKTREEWTPEKKLSELVREVKGCLADVQSGKNRIAEMEGKLASAGVGRENPTSDDVARLSGQLIALQSSVWNQCDILKQLFKVWGFDEQKNWRNPDEALAAIVSWIGGTAPFVHKAWKDERDKLRKELATAKEANDTLEARRSALEDNFSVLAKDVRGLSKHVHASLAGNGLPEPARGESYIHRLAAAVGWMISTIKNSSREPSDLKRLRRQCNYWRRKAARLEKLWKGG